MITRKNNMRIESLFEISNICDNNCSGCIYSFENRKDEYNLQFDDFSKSYNMVMNFSESNDLDIIVTLGTGNIFLLEEKTLKKYINIIFDNEYFVKNLSRENAIEFTTTLIKKDEYKYILEICDYILSLSKDTKIVFDLVIDIEKENSIENINDNIINLNNNLKDNIEWDIFVKFNNNLYDVDLKDKLSKYEMNHFLIDYLNLSINRRKNDDHYKEFSSWIETNVLKLKNDNISLFSENYNDYKKLYANNKNIENGVFIDMLLDFYITKKNLLFYTIDTYSGQFVINKKYFDEAKPIKINDIKDNNEFNKIVKRDILQNKIKNLKTINDNAICNKCDFNKSCPSYYVNALSKKFKVEITENNCLFGKQFLYKHLYDKDKNKVLN